MRVTCVVKRHRHHTVSGGYDRLAAAVGANVIVRKQIPGLFGKAANKVWRHLTPTKDYLVDYQIGDWLAELQALATGFFRPPDVLHVLYSSSIDLMIKWRNLLRYPLVVTFHAPFENVDAHRFDNYRKALALTLRWSWRLAKLRPCNVGSSRTKFSMSPTASTPIVSAQSHILEPIECVY